jgi:hypothetical protein
MVETAREFITVGFCPSPEPILVLSLRSHHHIASATIQLVNFWPDISLDEYINLKECVESRMVIADVTATGDDNPLDAKANDVIYRREQLRRLQEEVIELEDLKTGISITDLGLNDFRMDLVNYVKTHGDLPNLPNGMHAVIPAAPERGLGQM